MTILWELENVRHRPLAKWPPPGEASDLLKEALCLVPRSQVMEEGWPLPAQARGHPGTQRKRRCQSAHGRKGRAPWARSGCIDPGSSSPETGENVQGRSKGSASSRVAHAPQQMSQSLRRATHFAGQPSTRSEGSSE